MVREGYRETEIGVFPEDWEIIDFKDCFELLPNNTLSRANLNYDSGEVRNIHYGDILIHFPEVLDCSAIKLPYINNEYTIKNNHSFLKNGDIIIADTAEDEIVGKATEIFGIETEKVVSGLHTIPCRPKVKFEPKWLGYFINHNVYHDQLLPFITGTKVLAISKGSIKETKVVKPSPEEQIAITESLSDVEELISGLKKLIEKKKAIKKGAMQGLLTGKKRLSGFTGEWVKKKLGEVGVITGAGVDKKINDNETFVTLLNYLDVYRRTYIYRNVLDHVVTATNEKLLQCNVCKGDVFFTPTSETADDIARTAVAAEDMSDVVYSYHVVRLRPFEGYSGVFVKYACDTASFVEQATKFAGGSGTRYVISLPNFREQLEIYIPPTLEEQNAITEILTLMSTEIKSLGQKLAKYQQVKRGMMSELLTGKIQII